MSNNTPLPTPTQLLLHNTLLTSPLLQPFPEIPTAEERALYIPPPAARKGIGYTNRWLSFSGGGKESIIYACAGICAVWGIYMAVASLEGYYRRATGVGGGIVYRVEGKGRTGKVGGKREEDCCLLVEGGWLWWMEEIVTLYIWGNGLINS